MIIGAKRAIFLIVDRGPAHIAKKTRTFVCPIRFNIRWSDIAMCSGDGNKCCNGPLPPMMFEITIAGLRKITV
jgi:hypothetical protein